MTKPSKSLFAKLGVPASLRSHTLHAPDYYVDLLPISTSLANIGKLPKDSVWIQAFYDSRQVLEDEFVMLMDNLSSDGQLWISWPKKSSGVATDLDDSVVREVGLEHGLVDVKVAAVDETWSALKFVYRRSDR